MVIGRHPVLHLTDLFKQSLFVTFWDFTLEFLIAEGVFNVDAVRLKTVLGFNFLPQFLILILEFFGLFHKALNFLFRQPAFVISDCDFGISIGAFVASFNVHDTVCVNFKGNFDLGDSSGGRRNAIEIELSQKMVVSGHLTLSLEDLNEHTRLVVSISRENL